MKTPPPKIVVDGPQRLRRGDNYEEVRKQLLVEIAQRFELQRAGASIWGRICIDLRIRREVRAELMKRFPEGALYFAHS